MFSSHDTWQLPVSVLCLNRTDKATLWVALGVALGVALALLFLGWLTCLGRSYDRGSLSQNPGAF